MRRTLKFDWKPNAPSYFERDNPGEVIETEGWFCDLFVFGMHDETDIEIADQVDPAQWKFMVIPVCTLTRGTQSMLLSKALTRWPVVVWDDLKLTVENSLKVANEERLAHQAELRNLRGKIDWQGDLEKMRLD